ncbi:MAG: zinc ribbon domain-containing protein [Anaerolineae bacterium]
MVVIPIVLIALLVVGTFAFVFRPLFAAEYSQGKASGVRQLLPLGGAASFTVDELVARRDAIYAALKDAEFDRETGKLADEDYQIVRGRYMAEAAQVLRQLDHLAPEAEAALDAEIESAVAELRSDGNGHSAPDGHSAPEGHSAPHGYSADLVAAVEAEVNSLIQHAVASGKHELACPDCGRPYQAGDAFCAACGASLADTCPQCGVLYHPGDAFCARCGTPLTEEAESRE